MKTIDELIEEYKEEIDFIEIEVILKDLEQLKAEQEQKPSEIKILRLEQEKKLLNNALSNTVKELTEANKELDSIDYNNSIKEQKHTKEDDFENHEEECENLTEQVRLLTVELTRVRKELEVCSKK